MKLTIADRISLSNVLPAKDNYTNLCLREEVLKKTTFSSEEIEANEIKSEGERITWRETEPKEIDFKASEITYVFACLKKVSEANELTPMQLSIYKLFSEA